MSVWLPLLIKKLFRIRKAAAGLLIAALLILSNACALFPGFASAPTPTRTPTGIIIAVELTPSPVEEITPTADNFTITGSYEASSDVISSDKGDSVHTRIHMLANFNLSPEPGNRLQGTGQVVYVKDYEISGESCKTSWSTGDISWLANLDGQYEKKSDGSLQVFFTASPKTGPSYSADYLCLGSLSESAPWPGGGGTLVNGVYDQRQDFKLTGRGDVSGFSWSKEHMELKQ